MSSLQRRLISKLRIAEEKLAEAEKTAREQEQRAIRAEERASDLLKQMEILEGKFDILVDVEYEYRDLIGYIMTCWNRDEAIAVVNDTVKHCKNNGIELYFPKK